MFDPQLGHPRVGALSAHTYRQLDGGNLPGQTGRYSLKSALQTYGNAASVVLRPLNCPWLLAILQWLANVLTGNLTRDRAVRNPSRSSLDHEVSQQIFRVLAHPVIDPFTTRVSKKTQKYCSRGTGSPGRSRRTLSRSPGKAS